MVLNGRRTVATTTSSRHERGRGMQAYITDEILEQKIGSSNHKMDVLYRRASQKKQKKKISIDVFG
jgi:hypothetical protein